VRIGVVIGEYHREIVTEMFKRIEAKVKELEAELVETVWVPGTYEAPLVVKRLLARENIDCVVVSGYIEQGSTKHGKQMGVVTSALFKQLELEAGKPVGMGIIGPGATVEQAHARLDYGAHGVAAAVKMVHRHRELSERWSD